ncbi:uncharacterized protein CC84DRAFT_938038 [Paraphaeosphaeria sporulosa]|uniref:Uncharacterized protein n=1 Tax=Paraphaeosphaeria sporulosa TaxID=1460663 RepID=A0A177C593_9PLEO|nr:uncharacterized protein CC84DRAFT_938038 [Paraphaeosphaeria sporulosa]OAG02924.1 hypothetical protein CC84DRAFT_938038 [Paraphaeosphaeria sporulosa]
MPFYNMAKKVPTVEPVSVTDEQSPKASIEPKRPGTSGTELLLTTNRRTASQQYAAAQRAENAYKAKKRSASARQHRSEAASHFKLSAHHMKEGFKSCWSMVTAVPWVFKAWKEDRQAMKEKKAVERYMEKKKKLEERIAKQEVAQEKEKEPEA